MQGVCTVWQTQCVNWLYNKTKCTTYMCATYMCTTLPMIVTWVYVWQCDTEWQSMAEYGLCTEGSDEVGHTPARPSSSSHCGHFAPFLPSTTLRCCAYKYSTSWIIHDQRVVYFSLVEDTWTKSKSGSPTHLLLELGFKSRWVGEPD